jgi:hypothetical protein
MKKISLTLLLTSLIALNAVTASAVSVQPEAWPPTQETEAERAARGEANGQLEGSVVTKANFCGKNAAHALFRAHRNAPGSVERRAIPGDAYLTSFAQGYAKGQNEEQENIKTVTDERSRRSYCRN